MVTLRCIVAAAACAAVVARAQPDFVNWENPHVHPLDVTPDHSKLLAVNTADNRIEIFDITSAAPVHEGSIFVGLDPVSVRARTDNEAWVVNHISDSVSIVDLTAGTVIQTLKTLDEPADVVFAGLPQRAFVSCSQANRVLVFDPADPGAAPIELALQGEDPRAMGVSADGGTIFVAIFESGNRSTILGGGSLFAADFFPPNVVSDPDGPYGGINPPPNNGIAFGPPIDPANQPPPRVGLIVKKDADARWIDDNGGDWTDLVSGAEAAASGRPVGWDLLDHDVAVIDANALTVTYVTGLMNVCMAVAVQPVSAKVTVVGTDATNEIRFESNLRGRFLRVNLAAVDLETGTASSLVDLNPHLNYAASNVPQADREQSIGDPRGIVWESSGQIGYVSGIGSNNVAVIDGGGNRLAANIAVGEGPTGLMLDEERHRLYVLNKFDASISVIDTLTNVEIGRAPFFDPSPLAIKRGRKHLYDTHATSGLGHVACASCHVDARMDRLAWDLGDPQGLIKPFNQNCDFGSCPPWHPMKGPMVTQTLQDIIGKEPHHWRGDRDGLEEFSQAFVTLLGDDEPLSGAQMQEYEDFLASIYFPPNPFRDFDNTLPDDVPLPGHFTPDRFPPAGRPLPNGSAVRGLDLYRTANLDGVDCVSCHTLPTGVGTNFTLTTDPPSPLPVGPFGEFHHLIVTVDGSTNRSMKVPQLRNLYEKVGFDATQSRNTAGFGFLHDGSVDSLARFVSEPVFQVAGEQQVADLVAFMLSFSGSDLPTGNINGINELPGPSSQDTHTAVGIQTTLVDSLAADPAQLELIENMLALAQAGQVGLVVKGKQDGIARGYAYVPNGLDSFHFQSDRVGEVLTETELQTLAVPGSELTYTVVPLGSQRRIGIDRDRDGCLDGDEIDGGSNPTDPASIAPLCGDCLASGEQPPYPKNRFISVTTACAPGLQTALRVQMVSLHRPGNPVPAGSPDWTALEGAVRYVNSIEGAGGPNGLDCVDSEAFGTGFKCAQLGCEPEFRDWTTALDGEPLHIVGALVVPSSSYSIEQQTVECLAGAANCVAVSAALAIDASRFGDVELGGPLNVLDISTQVDKVKEIASSIVHTEPRAMLQPKIPDPVSGRVNVLDIAVVVDAVRGLPYPFRPNAADCCPGESIAGICP